MARNQSLVRQIVDRGVESIVSSILGSSSDRDGGRDSGFLRRTAVKGATGGLLTGGATALAATLFVRRARSRRPSSGGLLRGAAAGVGAATAVYLLHALLDRRDDDTGKPPREFTDEILAGAGRGVLYAALLAPWIPGPPVLRGAIAGTADYLTAPIGGLFSRLQPLSPIRKVPVISILLETGDAEDDPYLTFLVNGALLGLLYGRPSRSG
jgi:hypothetical protein